MDSRILSNAKEEREAASKLFEAPTISVDNREQVIDDLHDALYAARVCCYAQGLYLIKTASREYKWNVSLAECARLWTGGSVIRSKMLTQIQKAFSKNSDLSNLITDSSFVEQLNSKSKAWRRLVATCVLNGIACPSLSGSLGYLDTYRRQTLPANLIQAQRDFFGSHTYERVDGSGRRFHTAWTEDHKAIGNTDERTAGETLQTDVQKTDVKPPSEES